VKDSANTLRLGTRGSLLARKQSEWVAERLVEVHPSVVVDVVVIKTTGDRITDRPLTEIGGKGLFTKEIEQALIDRQIDFAVHSYKDLPVTMPLVDMSALTIVATPVREDPRDVLIVRDPSRGIVVPHNGVVGTSSLRRRAQLLSFATTATIKPLRGNIDTRLRKVRDGEYDAIILAMAGLKRAGLFERSYMSAIDVNDMLPAPAQGALAIQCRRDDRSTIGLLTPLNDLATAACVDAEREVVRLLNGDCHSPIAALGIISGETMTLRVAVGAYDGMPPVLWAEASGNAADRMAIAASVTQSLAKQGVQQHLQGGR
jgi:hydroxymethylbilane synthase